jgi:hypothetical protein
MLRIKNIKTKVSLKLAFSFLSFMLIGLAIFATPKASATEPFSWITSDPAIQVKDQDYTQHNYSIRHCTKQSIHIGDLPGSAETVCIFQADGFRYGIVNQQSGKSFVIGFPGDSSMYTVSGLPTDNIVWTPNSKHIVYRSLVAGSSSAYRLNIVKNLPVQLTRIVKNDLSTGYQLNSNAEKNMLNDEHGSPVDIKAVDSSSNGKWLVAQLLPGKLVRINMETFSLKLFSNYEPPFYSSIEFAVSDDGGVYCNNRR